MSNSVHRALSRPAIPILLSYNWWEHNGDDKRQRVMHKMVEMPTIPLIGMGIDIDIGGNETILNELDAEKVIWDERYPGRIEVWLRNDFGMPARPISEAEGSEVRDVLAQNGWDDRDNRLCP